MTINEFAAEVHKNAVDHGWWDGERTFPEIVALIHSEVSEALEEYRDGKPLLYFPCNAGGVCCEEDGSAHCGSRPYDPENPNARCSAQSKKPEGIAAELADVIIRVLDYCAYAGIDIENVLEVKHEYTDDFFGESNAALRPTMQLIHTQNQGIINGVKNSASIRFLAKVANMLKPEDITKERKRFTADNLSAENQSGMVIYDAKFADVKPIESKPFTVNAAQMAQINENVFNYFGTNAGILQNKYTEDEWNAYYEGKIEPFAIQLSLVMSNMTYTARELSFGNAITFTANRLQYASNQTKLNISTQLFDRGLLNRNGVMDVWNMAHVEGGEKYYIRKEYAEVSELGKEVTPNAKKDGSGVPNNDPAAIDPDGGGEAN